jgi:hypothetical protein
MTQFTVRVELHRADADDYETLHSAMKDEGFSRLIKSSDGKRYHLPTAEYDRSGELTRSEVLDSAGKAAAQTNKKASILVTESAGRTWRGLDPA